MAFNKVTVVGAGAWGTAVANLFAESNAATTLWAREPEVVESIRKYHQNELFLKDIDLNPNLKVSGDLEACLKEAELIICVVPTQYIRSTFRPVTKWLDAKPIINASKGIEQGTFATISEIFQQIAPKAPYLAFSGPSFAIEVAKKLPTAVTIAGKDQELATEIQNLISNAYFRAYTATDVMGVELGGALKNVIAVACGIASGLGLGHNSQAGLINRGLNEIVCIGKAKGADPLTFLGLSGMGDLVLTCTGDLSRNRRLGLAFGQGKKLEEIQKTLGGIAEGYFTAKAANNLAKKLNIEVPIIGKIYEILYEDKPPHLALKELMGRGLKEEWAF